MALMPLRTSTWSSANTIFIFLSMRYASDSIGVDIFTGTVNLTVVPCSVGFHIEVSINVFAAFVHIKQASPRFKVNAPFIHEAGIESLSIVCHFCNQITIDFLENDVNLICSGIFDSVVDRFLYDSENIVSTF